MKKNIAIVCGGFSGEYDVSIESAKLVKKYLDTDKYEAYLIVIEPNDWFYKTADGNKININMQDFSLQLNNNKVMFDAIFNVIHGTPGEDGKLQSYFDMIGIPYTSSGVDSSSLTFNKFNCNAFVSSYGINRARSMSFVMGEKIDNEKIVRTLGLPLFIKPNRSGSSVGISKVKSIEEIDKAISIAFEADNRVLVEEFVDGREIACGVLQKGSELIVLPLTEIVSKNEFFDYEAKYTKGMADEICPAPNVPEEIEQDIKTLSAFLFYQMDCKGFVRFDYIFTDSDLYFLEVNTIPGISEASILPQMALEFGLSFKEFFNIVLSNIIKN